MIENALFMFSGLVVSGVFCVDVYIVHLKDTKTNFIHILSK